MKLSLENSCLSLSLSSDADVVWWSDFLTANPEVPGSIPGATTLPE
jgi:hypothetical protein